MSRLLLIALLLLLGACANPALREAAIISAAASGNPRNPADNGEWPCAN